MKLKPPPRSQSTPPLFRIPHPSLLSTSSAWRAEEEEQGTENEERRRDVCLNTSCTILLLCHFSLFGFHSALKADKGICQRSHSGHSKSCGFVNLWTFFVAYFSKFQSEPNEADVYQSSPSINWRKDYQASSMTLLALMVLFRSR